MLKQRILTALVLLALLLPALWMQSPWLLACLMGLLVMGAAWEWARMNQLKAPTQVVAPLFFYLLLGIAIYPVWGNDFPATLVTIALWLVTIVWLLGVPWMLAFGLKRWLRIPQALRLVLGWLLITTCAFALIAAHQVGLNFLLSILCLVWVADIFAYFGGRLWGRRKLAPSISPGKTWAGVYTAAVGVLMMSGVWIWVDTQYSNPVPSLYTRMWHVSPWFWLAGTLFLLVFSVCGDLVESLVKRVSGFKDSSQLLPGHGGVLDRIDALLPVLPLSWLIYWGLTA